MTECLFNFSGRHSCPFYSRSSYYLRHFPSIRPSARRVLSLKSQDGFLWNLARVIDDWNLFDNLILVRIDCIRLWPIRYTWSCQTKIEFTVPEIACTKKKTNMDCVEWNLIRCRTDIPSVLSIWLILQAVGLYNGTVCVSVLCNADDIDRGK